MLIPSHGSETFPIQAGGQTKQVICFCHHHASYKTIVAAVTIPSALFGTVTCLTELVPAQDDTGLCRSPSLHRGEWTTVTSDTWPGCIWWPSSYSCHSDDHSTRNMLQAPRASRRVHGADKGSGSHLGDVRHTPDFWGHWAMDIS